MREYRSGDVVGSWQLLSRLGAGGTGQVWSATDAFTGHMRAAVKLVDSRAASSESFASEVRTLSSIHHPAVVRVLGAGELPGGAWLAMELLDGETLYERARHGLLAASQAAELLGPVAEALVACHRVGLFHGDVTPANIFAHRDGTARLIDFGLSGRLGEAGTPGYAVDGPAAARDAHGLGATLWYAATGRDPIGVPLPLRLAAEGPLDDVVRGLTSPESRLDLAAAATALRHIAAGHRARSRPPQTVQKVVTDPGTRSPSAPRVVDTVVARDPDPAPRAADVAPAAPWFAAVVPDRAHPEPPPAPDEPRNAWFDVRSKVEPAVSFPLPAPDFAPAEGRARSGRTAGYLGVGAVLLVGSVIATVGVVGASVAYAGWVQHHRDEARVDAAEAWRLVTAFKTDPAENRKEESLVRASDLLDRAAPWVGEETGRGRGSLIRVWRSGWHFARAEWDRERYEADLAAIGDPSDGYGRFARGLLQANSCQLRRGENSADHAASCADASSFLDRAWTDASTTDGWYRVEVGWTQVGFWSELAGVASEAGDPAMAQMHLRRAVRRCGELADLVDQAPVNGIELADECVVVAGRLADWSAYLQWSAILVDLETPALPDDISQRRAARIFESAGPGCGKLVGRSRSRVTVGQARDGAGQVCRRIGLLALGCVAHAEASPWYAMSYEDYPLLRELGAAAVPRSTCPVSP